MALSIRRARGHSTRGSFPQYLTPGALRAHLCRHADPTGIPVLTRGPEGQVSLPTAGNMAVPSLSKSPRSEVPLPDPSRGPWTAW